MNAEKPGFVGAYCNTPLQVFGSQIGLLLYYRYRVGDYRVIYSIDDEAMQVLVDAITHRSKVYDS
ncbi:MAG: type II toxin-antitoxin system RelE/ParE family toxin [Stigonema ocellatum SAG 48.90 = DSM 106950]|nr:type II toxin-antitoxin system RelE/ParE family toxin [Stigonema ocellatum SAG 48.90 = DSM 106950]